MLVIAIIGILAAIAIPNFIRFQARSKQAEAKSALKAVFTGQRSQFAEKERYSTRCGDIAFSPERGNRYLYDLGTVGSGSGCVAGEMEDRTAGVATQPGPAQCGIQADVFRHGLSVAFANLSTITGAGVVTSVASTVGLTPVIPSGTSVGVYGTCPNCGFSAAARGNVDVDPSVDVFLVSSEFLGVAAAPCVDDPVSPDTPGAPLSIRSDVLCD